MTDQARVPHAPITGVSGAMAKRLARKRLGQVPEPLGVMWHNQRVLRTLFGISRKADRWKACDRQLKAFAHLAVASKVGCSFCLDLGYFEAHHGKLDLAKAREVPRWREADSFTPLERDVLEYAEAMTSTPPTVTDEMSARLQERMGAPALVELTAFVAMANLVSRNNVALGIHSQGFATSCGLQPLAVPAPA